uniref:Uncharacterized protein n=1 Tax=Sander lucioperca TaxID=283035 RepID=A0A8D0AE51_SANLU
MPTRLSAFLTAFACKYIRFFFPLISETLEQCYFDPPAQCVTTVNDSIPLPPLDFTSHVCHSEEAQCGFKGRTSMSCFTLFTINPSMLPSDPVSPLLSDDDSSPQDPLSFQHPSIFLPHEDVAIPLDFELRESAVPGGGFGIWSRRRVNVGERFGPYEGEHMPCLQDPTQGWEYKHEKCSYKVFLQEK